MDTWLKKILYNPLFKFIAVISVCVGILLSFIGLVGMWSRPYYKSIYEDYQVQSMLVKKAGFARDLIVKYRTPKIIETITDEEFSQLMWNNPELTSTQAKAQIAEDRRSYLRKIEYQLKESNTNVDYFLKCYQDGEVITNMDITLGEQTIKKDLETRNLSLVGDGDSIIRLVDNYNGGRQLYPDHYNYYIGEESVEGYEVYVALKNELVEGDEFYNIHQRFIKDTMYQDHARDNLSQGILLIIIFMPFWILVVGRKAGKKEVALNWFDKIPLEIQALIAIISCLGVMLLLGILEGASYSSNIVDILYGNSDIYGDGDIHTAVIALIFALIALMLAVFSSFVKHIKNRSLLYYIGVFRCIGKVKNYIINNAVKSGKLKYIALIVTAINAAAIFVIIVSAYMFYIVLPIFLLLVWSVLVLVFISKIISDYNKVIDGTKDIAEGNIESKIQLESNLPIFNELAESINTIGDGLDKAILKSIKSERLKTELITNVSHDLKTPLTSIISYIDLLKAEEIDNKVAKEYIDILDERSTRLKYLIEDLVEASKAVTGNTKVNTETFSLDELVVQSVGEYTDRLENSEINIVMQKIDKVYVEGDTKHMWRVTENLLSNITKYAMPNTRAYIEVKAEGEVGVLTIKNISKDELNIDPQELTQRFVRGEESRSTEGSGLGLAIASSLMNIQKGNLKVSIDGDLFKVEVKLPKVDYYEVQEVKQDIQIKKEDMVNDSIKVNNVDIIEEKDIKFSLDKQ